jgi:hypothetical protein
MNARNVVYQTVNGAEVMYTGKGIANPIVLLPDEATDPLTVGVRAKQPPPEVIGGQRVRDPEDVFSFTDAKGKRWQRTGSQQPVPSE